MARVNDEKLTKDDARAYLKLQGSSINDSVALKILIQDWTNYQALIQELKSTNPSEYNALKTKSIFYQGELALYHLSQKHFRNILEPAVNKSILRQP